MQTDHAGTPAEPSGNVIILADAVASTPAMREERSDVRMFHLDATRRLKPRALLQVAYPMVFDTWRERFDMEALVAQGIWPFSSYIDVAAGNDPLAAGRPGRFQSAIRCGQIAPAYRGAGGLVLATQVTLHAQRSGGDALDFTQASGDAAGSVAGYLQIMVNLVRPFATPDQRVVSALPEQMSGLELCACEPPPAKLEPETTQAGQRSFESTQPAMRIAWGLQHTDANHTVLSAEYLTHAEDLSLLLAREAGLEFASLRTQRARLVLKRAFMAGQEAVMRGRLWIEPDAHQLSAFVTFHALDAAGNVDERPAIQVRLNAGV